MKPFYLLPKVFDSCLSSVCRPLWYRGGVLGFLSQLTRGKGFGNKRVKFLYQAKLRIQMNPYIHAGPYVISYRYPVQYVRTKQASLLPVTRPCPDV